MANKRKINPLQSQVSLQRTKQYKPANSPYTKPPYDRNQRVPYGPRGVDYRDAIALSSQAAQHPGELLAFNLGQAIGNYVDRHNDKKMYEQQSIAEEQIANALGYLNSNDAYNALMRREQAATQPQADAANQALSGNQVDTERALSNVDQEKAAQQRDQEVQQAAMNLINNGTPVTAAGAKALGLSANDRQKFFVQDSVLNGHEIYGPNPTQAKIQEDKLAKQADAFSQANMAMVPYEQLRQVIDQYVDPLKTSSRRKQIIKQNLLERFGKQADSQAQQQAQNALIRYYQEQDPQKRQQLRANIFDMGYQLSNAGRNQAANALLTPLIQEEQQKRADALAFEKFKQQEQWKLDHGYGQAGRAARGYGSTGSSGGGAVGRPSRGTNKNSTGDDELDYYLGIMQKSPADSLAYTEAKAKVERLQLARTRRDNDMAMVNTGYEYDDDGTINWNRLAEKVAGARRQRIPFETLWQHIETNNKETEGLQKLSEGQLSSLKAEMKDRYNKGSDQPI